jgi:hypothetical protein
MNLLWPAMVVLGFLAEGPVPDFSRIWKQSKEQCWPKRTGVTLRIQHRDTELVVETTSNGLSARHVLQRYSTDGVESKSTGADGGGNRPLSHHNAVCAGRLMPTSTRFCS